jgi:hypothetical protein
MQAARVFLVLSTSLVIGVAFAACGGKVTGESDGDAGVDASPTTKPTTTTTPTTTTVGPPACPTYRPIRGTACTAGLSCFYPCTDTYDTSIRATCPSGVWTTSIVASCDAPGPPPADCDACVRAMCPAERKACERDPMTLAACTRLFDCLKACTSTECQNKCISDSTSIEGKEFLQCVVEKCPDVCRFE